MVLGLKTGGGYDVTEILTNGNNDGSVIIAGFGAGGSYSVVVVIPVNYSDSISGSFNLAASYSTTYAGNIASVDIKPETTSLITGDNGINGKQQYYLMMMDDNNGQVLQNGTKWTDNSPHINMNGNGLAVLTGTVAGSTIYASFLTHTASALLSAVSPAAMTPGTPRGCEITNIITNSDSRCFIATAAFGSPLHPYVGFLREFRDVYLLTNPSGRWIVSLYYSNSPPIAEIISDIPGLKVMVKLFLIPAIIISWVLLKTTLSAKIVIAVLMLILISIIFKIFKICPAKY